MKMSRYQLHTASAGLVAAAFCAASPALAAVTYHYGGSVPPVNSRDGGIVNFIDANAPIQFDFTLATDIAANLSGADIKASMLSWAVTGGKAQSSVSSTDIAALLGHAFFTTDGQHNITAWFISGHADIAALPQDELDFLFDSGTSDSETLRWINIGNGQNTGGATSTTGALGRFVKLDAAPGVPEPSTWALMITGFGVVGYGLRRRRNLAVV